MATAKKSGTTKKAANQETGKEKDAPAKPVDVKAEIAEALAALKVAKTTGEKKGLRRKLRALGHEGGLRLPKAPPQKKGA